MNKNQRKIIFKDEVYAIIGAAMEVPNELRSGFLEAVYQEAMELELRLRGVPYMAQVPIRVVYKGHVLSKEFVPDLICFDQIIVELEAIKQLTSVEDAQPLNYLLKL